MKHGRALTKNQKIFLKAKHLNPDSWLLERDTTTETIFISKYGDRKISFKKERAI